MVFYVCYVLTCSAAHWYIGEGVLCSQQNSFACVHFVINEALCFIHPCSLWDLFCFHMHIYLHCFLWIFKIHNFSLPVIPAPCLMPLLPECLKIFPVLHRKDERGKTVCVMQPTQHTQGGI